MTLKNPEADALRNRYSDAYRLANANERLGGTYQGLAIILGIVAVGGAIVAAVTLENIPIAVVVGFVGLLFAAYLNGVGVQISAQGQLLKANIDSAINTSPFLNNEQRSVIMSLSSSSRDKYDTTASLEATGASSDSESYTRFFSTDDSVLTLRTVETHLKQLNRNYTIEDVRTGLSETGTLKFGTDTIGQLEIDHLGGDFFDDDIKDFKEAIQDIQHPNKKTVAEILNSTKTIVAVKLPSDVKEGVQEKIEPLWKWLFSNNSGLLHVDGEGFYQGKELIFELE